MQGPERVEGGGSGRRGEWKEEKGEHKERRRSQVRGRQKGEGRERKTGWQRIIVIYQILWLGLDMRERESERERERE